MVGWQLDNEFGCHDTVRSYDHNAKKRFRSWLQDKYGTIENMNERQGRVFWSSQYASFDTVEPPFLEVYTNNQAHTLDWYTFSSDMVIDFAKEQVEILRMYAPTHAITTNFMVFFTDFDHHKFNREVRMDLATFDEYPLAGTTAIPLSDQEMQDYMRTGVPDLQALQHALYRGISGEAFGTNHGPFGVMEMQPGVLNWNPYRVSPLEGMVRLWTHETFAASGDMVGYFRWRQVPYAQEQTLSGLFLSDNSEDQGYIESQTFAHNDLPKLRSSLQSTTTTTRQADVALIFDYTAHWIWNIEPYSGSWSVKEASYTNPTLTYTTLVHTFYSSLRRLGLSIDIISPEQDVSGYKILVIPSLPIIPESLSNALGNLSSSSSSSDDESPPPTVILGPHTGSRTADFAYVPGLGIDKLESILPGLRVTRIETPPPPTTMTSKGAGSSVRFKNVEYAIGGWEEWIVCDDNSSNSDGDDDNDAVIITVESTSRHRLRKGKSAAAACSFPFPFPKSTTNTTAKNRIHYISFNPPAEFLIEYIRDILPHSPSSTPPSSPSTSPNSDGKKYLDLGPAIRILRRENLLWIMNYGWEEEKVVVVGLDEGEEEMLEGMLGGLLDQGEEIGEMIIGGGDEDSGKGMKGNGTITIPAAGVMVWKIV